MKEINLSNVSGIIAEGIIVCPKIEIRKGVSDPESSSGRQDYLDSVLAF